MPSLSALATRAKQETRVLPSVKKNAATKSTPLLKSTEKVADSDMESDTESEEEETQDDSAEDEVREDSQAKVPVAATTKMPQTAKPPVLSTKHASPATSSSDGESRSSNSASDTDSGSESASETLESDSADEDRSEDDSPSEVIAAPNPAKVIPYSPPAGFAIFEPMKKGKAKSAEIFSSANLAKKQIWYITAPALISIKSIKKVSTHDVLSGKSSISVAGQDYGFVRENVDEQSTSRLLLPDEQGNVYRLAARAIDQTLHLQQSVELPSTLSGSGTIPKRPVRQQPKGLKMQFKPLGFGAGPIGTIGSETSSSESDEEVEASLPAFREPAVLLDGENTSSSDAEMVDAREDQSASVSVPLDEVEASMVPMATVVKEKKKKDTEGIKKRKAGEAELSTSRSQAKKARRASDLAKTTTAANTHTKKVKPLEAEKVLQKANSSTTGEKSKKHGKLKHSK